MSAIKLTEGTFFFDDDFLEEDSEQGVQLYEIWRKNHPQYHINDADATGVNIAMAAMRSTNVTLLKHVISLGGSSLLNRLDSSGYTIFGGMLYSLLLCGKGSPVEKMVECAEIAIDAGANVDLKGFGDTSAPLHHYIKIGEPLENAKWDKYVIPLIKIFLMVGVNYGSISSRWVNKAREELLDWEKTRLLYLAQKGVPLNLLPKEIVNLIQEKITHQNLI